VPASLIDHSAPLIQVIPRLLTPDECQEWVDRIRSRGPVPDSIRTSRGEMVDNEVRNNRRVIFDNQAWAERLFDRVRGSAPQFNVPKGRDGHNDEPRRYAC
jgi:hypothetical protein